MNTDQSEHLFHQHGLKFCFYKPYWKDHFSLPQKGDRLDAATIACGTNSVEYSAEIHTLKKAIALYNLVNYRFSLCACDVHVLLDEVIADLEALAQQRGIIIRVYSDVAVKIFSSPELLKLIFFNLLENAIIYAKPDPHYAYIEVDCALVNDQLRIIVEDNGIGMGTHDLSLPEEKNGGNPNGLGLILVKKALDLMHGSIQVESIAGCYTKMSVTLNFID